VGWGHFEPFNVAIRIRQPPEVQGCFGEQVVGREAGLVARKTEISRDFEIESRH